MSNYIDRPVAVSTFFVENAIDNARLDLAIGINHDDPMQFGLARGILSGLLLSKAIDQARYVGTSNEFRFMWFRALERRREGLPV